MTDKLNSNFLNELFRIAFRERQIFDILIQYLEYHYLPTQEYKEIWKCSKIHYETFQEIPTIGLLAEQNKMNIKVLEQLNQIKNADIVPKNSLLAKIEEYIRDVKFLNLYDKIGELRESGNKEGAIKELQKGTEEISKFSLQSQQFESVFKNFENRYFTRSFDNASKTEGDSRCIFGINCLDDSTKGGLRKKRAALITASSGVGKSKFLRWIAYSNARLGKRMLHFQLEGSKEECLLAYEAMISGSPYYNLETTSLEESKLKEAITNSNKVTGDIHVIAYEEFGVATMKDIRNSVIEYIKTYGIPDGIVVDYLDECDPGDGKKYPATTEGEKFKKQAVAKYFVNLCIEQKLSGFIATQASDIPKEKINDPNFVITRSNTSGDRLLVKKFVNHITLNQTDDEYKNGIMRLHEDKSRFSKSKKTHYICTAYEYEKFYDIKRTRNMFS